jgi:hypothetical protein
MLERGTVRDVSSVEVAVIVGDRFVAAPATYASNGCEPLATTPQQVPYRTVATALQWFRKLNISLFPK